MNKKECFDTYDLNSIEDVRAIAREEAMKILKGEFGKKVMREFFFDKNNLEAVWVIFNGKTRDKA